MRTSRLRWLGIGLLAVLVFSAVGCSYVVRMDLQVLDAPQSQRGREMFNAVVTQLRKHHDGCYSSHHADYTLVADNLNNIEALFTLKDKAIEARLSLDWNTGIVRVTLHEQTEPRLSPAATQCYRQLNETIREVYASFGVHEGAQCKQPPCVRD